MAALKRAWKAAGPAERAAFLTWAERGRGRDRRKGAGGGVMNDSRTEILESASDVIRTMESEWMTPWIVAGTVRAVIRSEHPERKGDLPDAVAAGRESGPDGPGDGRPRDGPDRTENRTAAGVSDRDVFAVFWEYRGGGVNWNVPFLDWLRSEARDGPGTTSAAGAPPDRGPGARGIGFRAAGHSSNGAMQVSKCAMISSWSSTDRHSMTFDSQSRNQCVISCR